jgi:hypothetical protein
VKLYSRPGNDLTCRFPLIVEAIAKLCSQSCIIDGEAVACGEDGIASFPKFSDPPLDFDHLSRTPSHPLKIPRPPSRIFSR